MCKGTDLILKTAVDDTPDQSAETFSGHGIDLLAANRPEEAAQAFRDAIAVDAGHCEAHHGLIRALRDAGELEQSIAAAQTLATLMPDDPLAQTALSISLQSAGRVPEAEAAGARARILEWKMQLASSGDRVGADEG
jgi:predicted Zn-dependent protease